MKKNAYYFPHFSNARNDQKILKLRRVLGAEGYGIYWMLLEMLRDTNAMHLHIDSIADVAFELHVTPEKVEKVINDFGLFTVKDGDFYSEKFIEYLKPYLEKSRRAKDAAMKRWNSEDKEGMQMHSKCNADAMQTKQNKTNNNINIIKGKIFDPLKNREDFEDNFPDYLTSKYSTNELTSMTERLVDYCLSKGKTYKDYYRALKTFLANNQSKPNSNEVGNIFENLSTSVDRTKHMRLKDHVAAETIRQVFGSMSNFCSMTDYDKPFKKKEFIKKYEELKNTGIVYETRFKSLYDSEEITI